MKIGLSLSGLLQHEGSGDMVQRFADVLDLVRFGRELGFDYTYRILYVILYLLLTSGYLLNISSQYG